MAEPSVATGHGTSAAAPAPEPFTKSLERMNYFQEPEARALIADRAAARLSGLDAGCDRLYACGSRGGGLRGRVLGIEPTAERVEAARELVGKRLDAGRLEFREGDATALGMKDGSLDWVWCGDVLHHILDTDKALSEFRRVVRPGGRVVIKESQVLSAMFLPGHPELERASARIVEFARRGRRPASRSAGRPRWPPCARRGSRISSRVPT